MGPLRVTRSDVMMRLQKRQLHDRLEAIVEKKKEMAQRGHGRGDKVVALEAQEQKLREDDEAAKRGLAAKRLDLQHTLDLSLWNTRRRLAMRAMTGQSRRIRLRDRLQITLSWRWARC